MEVPAMSNEHSSDERQLKQGEPCGHSGCLSHVSHPCEGCGRVGGLSFSIPEDKRRLLDSPPFVPLTLKNATSVINGEAIEDGESIEIRWPNGKITRHKAIMTQWLGMRCHKLFIRWSINGQNCIVLVPRRKDVGIRRSTLISKDWDCEGTDIPAALFSINEAFREIETEANH